LANDKPLIFFDLTGPVGVHEESSFFDPGECHDPFAMCTDIFGWLQARPTGTETDVNVPDGLSMFVVRFKGVITGVDFVEGVITGVDFVKVDIVSEGMSVQSPSRKTGHLECLTISFLANLVSTR
jgi:hypothetical protein